MAGIAAGLIGTNFITNFILNVSLSQSLSMMLSLVKQLQIIVHLLLMDVIMPANTGFLFSFIIGILTYDPINISDQVRIIAGLDDIQIEDENFKALSYGSPYALINFGSLNLILLISAAIFLIHLLCSICYCVRLKTFGRDQLKKTCCNRVLSFIDCSFLVLLFNSLLNIQTVSSGKAKVNSSYWISLVLIILCLAFWIFQIIFFFKYYDRLQEPLIKERFGIIYEDSNLTKDYKRRVMHRIVSIFRVILLCVSIIFWQKGDWLVIQVSLVNILTIWVINELGNKPYKLPAINRFELASESLILLIINCILTCSLPEVTPDAREYVGFFINTMVILNIALTQAYIFKENYRTIRLRCLKCKY